MTEREGHVLRRARLDAGRRDREFARVGGHTSCVAVVDAATSSRRSCSTPAPGSRRSRAVFGAAPFRGTILLTHLHWDHMQGLPFFPPADRDDAEVTLVQPAQGDPLAMLARAMSPPHFPIAPDGLRGTWKYVGIEPGRHEFGASTCGAREVQHKGGRAFGYRVDRRRRRRSRTSPTRSTTTTTRSSTSRATSTSSSAAHRSSPPNPNGPSDFGHGTVEHAVEIAARAGVRRLILTHHGPIRTDDQVAAIAAGAGVDAAHEGLVIDLD